MCNAAGANATAYTHALVDALVPGLASAPAPDTVSADAAVNARLRGIYRDMRTNTTVRLDTARGQLQRVGAGVLRPLRDGSYLMGAARVRFTRAGDGRPETMRQPTADGDTVVFAYVTESAWVPTAAELASVAGRYRNDEIGATYTVTVANGKLTVSPRVGAVDTLTPTYRDAFSAGGGSAWFTRDAKGRVTAMHFGSARAWDFVSVRVP